MIQQQITKPLPTSACASDGELPGMWTLHTALVTHSNRDLLQHSSARLQSPVDQKGKPGGKERLTVGAAAAGAREGHESQ